MHAVLAAQHAVSKAAFDLQRDLVQAYGLGAGHQVKHADLPTFQIGIARVHVVQHVRPVLGLKAALAGAYGEDAIASVETARKPAGDFKLVKLRVKRLKRGLDLFGERRVLARQFMRDAGIVK